jgi:uncharacterized alkaline shock family protein YloU
MKKYYITEPNKKFSEITEQEFISLYGTINIRAYVNLAYHNKLSISEVPTELQEQVQTTVNNRIAKFGEYN